MLFGYRHFWLFENSVTGRAISTIDPSLRHSVPFVVLRAASCTLLVPVFEELFWRSWMMRWLIKPHFQEIPFGTYVSSAFWTVAAMFAIEHGPYWEVGLVAGISYNWWAIRTRSLADCILVHAVTNGLLSAFVLFTGQWQYWS
jgi:CAAX prenyl protease-like protein